MSNFFDLLAPRLALSTQFAGYVCDRVTCDSTTNAVAAGRRECGRKQVRRLLELSTSRAFSDKQQLRVRLHGGLSTTRVGRTCRYRHFMLKWDPTCNETLRNASSANAMKRKRGQEVGKKKHSKLAEQHCVNPLFVTGCGGSGTHFVSNVKRGTLSKRCFLAFRSGRTLRICKFWER